MWGFVSCQAIHNLASEAHRMSVVVELLPNSPENHAKLVLIFHTRRFQDEFLVWKCTFFMNIQHTQAFRMHLLRLEWDIYHLRLSFVQNKWKVCKAYNFENWTSLAWYQQVICTQLAIVMYRFLRFSIWDAVHNILFNVKLDWFQYHRANILMYIFKCLLYLKRFI